MSLGTDRMLGKSQQRAAAFAAAAAVMLVPANLVPVLITEIPGRARTDTILSGIVGLGEDGSWAVAAIVFAASIVVPLLKIGGITVLLFAARRRPARHRPTLLRVYAMLRLIGRWSMLDVFLVAFLSGAVRFGMLAKVEPGLGIIAFASAVVLTMLATDAFDPKPLRAEENDPSAPA